MNGKANESLKKLICAGISILFITASAEANLVNSNSIVKDGIEYYIQTDKAVHNLGESVEMLYRVTNLGSEVVEFIFSYGPLDNTCDWMVDKDGLRIWDNLGRPVTWALTSFRLDPLQSYEYRHTWDMTDKNGNDILPGNYTVTGALGYCPPCQKYVPVSVPVDIIREQRTYYVNPGESIQARIDDPNVVDGDTIIVFPGNYIENINFKGKNIILRSTDPNDPDVVAATIIDGNNNGSVVTFNNGEDANCVLNGFSIINGCAKFGGGIFCLGPLPPPPPPIPPSECNCPGPTITNCIISNNSADAGGGIYTKSIVIKLINCNFTNNSAIGSESGGSVGGGMYNSNSSPTLKNCAFAGNSADVGGGMHNFISSPTLTSCAFNENYAQYSGGGMSNQPYLTSVKQSNPTLTNCNFKGNSAQYSGGGIDDRGSRTTLTNCTFNENSAGSGGGIFGTGSNLKLTNCTFNENSALYSGGGMLNFDSCTTLTDCTFSSNTADVGGGMCYERQMFSEYEITLILTNCTFKVNSAQCGGGMFNGSHAMSINEITPILTNCTFKGNSARYGGGMFNNHSSPTVTNCTFSGNSAGVGGGMYNQGPLISGSRCSPIITNCTFTKNLAASSGIQQGWGGAIFNTGSDATLSNCILWGNTATEGNEIYLDFYFDFFGADYPSTINVRYSNVCGRTSEVFIDPGCMLNWDDGNIDADPCFVQPGYWDANGTPNNLNDDFWIEGDYHLLQSSPCINSGDPNYVAEPNDTDLDGRPRVINGRIDMGAYEYSPPIQANVRIVPRTISLASSGNWIAAFLRLPEEYNIADIDPNSISLENEIEPERFWLSEDNQTAIAKFDREQVQNILSVGEIELTITGRLIDGQLFEGTDVIKVTDTAGKKSTKKKK